MSKYKAQPTVVDGVRFASKREAARYSELLLLVRARQIRCLVLQPNFVLMAPVYDGYTAISDINQGRFSRVSPIGHYRADFKYEEFRGGGNWLMVVEDCKGFRTDVYRWKKRHFERQYGIEIRET